MDLFDSNSIQSTEDSFSIDSQLASDTLKHPDYLFLSALKLLEGETPENENSSNKNRDIKRARTILQTIHDKCNKLPDVSKMQHPISTYLLGLLHLRGFGGRIDKSKGEKLCKASACESMHMFEKLLEFKQQKGFGRINEASEDENPNFSDFLILTFSLYCLGCMHLYGHGIKKNHEISIVYFKIAAAQGNSFAQNDLGLRYKFGEGVEQNFEKAFELFKSAAGKGHPDSQCIMGFFYDNGRGVETNHQQADAFFKLAAGQGYYLGQYNMGLSLEDGSSGKRDYKRAVYYYEKAAEQGYVEAQYRLGQIFESGLGWEQNDRIEKNVSKAFEYYQSAAYLGHAKAQYYLGCMFENGNGVEKNISEAIEYYKLSAAAGYSMAQWRINNLGFFDKIKIYFNLK